jgi:putative transposase
LQHCFWEHQIRDDNDLAKYIHFNPVKHSYVGRVCDWPYSTLHRYVLCRAHTIAWPGSVMVKENRTVNQAAFAYCSFS